MQKVNLKPKPNRSLNTNPNLTLTPKAKVWKVFKKGKTGPTISNMQEVTITKT